MGLRIGALIVDAHDPGRLARFWAEALDWVISQAEDPEWVVEPREGSREDCVVADLLFIKVPEAKAGKNRLHLDLRPTDQAAEVARLEKLGAIRAEVGQGADVSWVVMADPEGNEFCVQDAHPPQVRTQWLKRYEAYSRFRPERDRSWASSTCALASSRAHVRRRARRPSMIECPTSERPRLR